MAICKNDMQSTFTLLLATLLIPGCLGHEEQLIGWQGEKVRDPAVAASLHPELLWDPANLEASQPDDIPLPASQGWVEQIR